MAITHSEAARNAATNTMVDLIDVGSGDNGSLEILTSGDALLATVDLDKPAFGNSSSGVATAAAITPTTASGTGTAAKFQVKDCNGTVIFSGTVGTSGADLILDNTSINTGQTININSFTYSALVQ